MSLLDRAKVSKPEMTVDSGIGRAKSVCEKSVGTQTGTEKYSSYFYKHQKHFCWYFSLSIVPQAMGSLFAGKSKRLRRGFGVFG